MIQELDRVVLSQPIPSLGLEAGDIGTVVLVHTDGKGFEVEFVTLDGETHAVTTLTQGDIRSIKPNELAHARTVASV